VNHKFVTKIQRSETKIVAGIVVPPEIVEGLGSGKRPPVKVTLNGYTYRSTVASMGGRFMIGLSAENRQAAGLVGDEELEVALELDTEPRNTPPPKDLKAALVKARRLEAFETRRAVPPQGIRTPGGRRENPGNPPTPHRKSCGGAFVTGDNHGNHDTGTDRSLASR
jgi:Domain of unknown function (DUF1905)